MGVVLSVIERIIDVASIVARVVSAFQGIIDFFQNTTRMITDMVFSQRQFEYASEEDKQRTQQKIAEERRKKAGFRLKMTCKCCNQNLIDYVFDCADSACKTCNERFCADRCFSCNEIIRRRGYLDYDRSVLY